MFCCMLPDVHSSIAIILMGKRELVALLDLSSWCLVMVERLFLAVQWCCLRFVIVVFPDHTILLFFKRKLRFLVPLNTYACVDLCFVVMAFTGHIHLFEFSRNQGLDELHKYIYLSQPSLHAYT